MSNNNNENYVTELMNHLSISKVTSSQITYSGGIKTTRNKFIREVMTPKVLRDVGLSEIAFQEDLERFKNLSAILDDIARTLQANRKTIINTDDYIVARNVETNEMVILYKSTKLPSQICYESYSAYLEPALREVVYGSALPCRMVYDPYDPSHFININLENEETLVKKINLFRPPEWWPRRIINASCPEIYSKFMEHLFPSQEARDYVYRWIYRMVVSRNETYLVLNGAKGIGKGVFASILKSAVGKNHYSEAPLSLLTDKFNSSIDKKRFVLMDEFHITKETHTVLKKIINKEQAIERKGYDATDATEIFTSYMISNNDSSDVYIESDDRRFSIMDTTKSRLEDVTTEEYRLALIKSIETSDESFIAFISWVLETYRHNNTNAFEMYKSEKFYELVHSSLSLWQKKILDAIPLFLKDGLLSFEISKAYKRISGKRSTEDTAYPRHSHKYNDFARSYRINGKVSIGEFYNEDGKIFLRLSEEVIKYYESKGIKVPTKTGSSSLLASDIDMI